MASIERIDSGEAPKERRAVRPASSGGDASAVEREKPSIRDDPVIRLAALLLLVALVGMATRLVELPLNRAIELRYCQKYYLVHDPPKVDRDGNVSEALCKVNKVQQDLGWMQGALGTLTILCDIAITAPMGLAVDRLGPRLVLFLNLLASTVYVSWLAIVGKFWTIFPVNALLAAPFLSLFGGGSCVARMVCLAMVTRIAQTDQRLPTYVAYVSSAEYVTSLASSPLSAALLEQSIWLPFGVGLACIGAAAPLIILLPRQERGTKTRSRRTSQSEDTQSSEREPLLSSSVTAGAHDKTCSSANPVRAFFVGYIRLLAKSRSFQMIMVVFLVKGAADSSNVLLLQYISKRFNWTFAEVGYLFTLKAVINVFALTVIVPVWSKQIARHMDFSPAQAALVGSKAALCSLTLGAALIASSSAIWMLIASLPIYALGTIAPAFLYALAKSPAIGLMTPENEGKAFAAIVLCRSFGELLGLPACAAIWIRAIELGGAGYGLPFYFSAALLALATTILWRTRLSDPSQTGNTS